MTRLDERLRRELERAGRPADPTGVYEELIRRRERRRIARRLQAGALALAVSAGSFAGIWALTRGSGGGIVATPGHDDVIAAVLFPEVGPEGLALISAADGSVRMLLPPGEPSSRGILGPVSWSPDGERLAVWHLPEGDDAEPAGIYAMHIAGGEPTLLFETDLSISAIAWSPDGGRIAVAGMLPVDRSELDRPVDPGELHVRATILTIATIAADGSDLREIPVQGIPQELAWSPDGSTLAITEVSRGGELGVAEDIYLLDLATGRETRLTDDGRSRDPAWSPDGSRIAFVSGSPRFERLFVVSTHGTGLRRLTDPDGTDASPTWSPDGEWIAVARRVPSFTGASGALGPSGVAGVSGPLGGETCQVVLVRADGSGERVLVDGPIDGACPIELAWRPAPTAELTTPGEPSPAATSAPPAASPVPEPAVGETFDPSRVCDLSALEADYDGDGATDVAVVYTLPRDGACPEPGDGETRLGIALGATEADIATGAIELDLTYGPLECGPTVGCSVFAAPDLDGDGAAELALVQDAGASVEILGLYRVDICLPAADCPRPNRISPIEVADPGAPQLDLVPGPARIVWGGSVMVSFGAYCGPMEGDPPVTDPGFVVWLARYDPDGPRVHEALFRLEGTELVPLATHDYRAPATAASLPPGGGPDLCGAPAAGSSGD